jgi:phospholipid transport system substrate-binding protein
MGLTKYSGQDIKVFPFRGDPGDRRARIHTEVSGQDGKTVPVDFTMHKTSEGWKAYDVSIEGVSYVTNYRNEFANEIQQTSLDALIARLRKKTSEADVATPDSAQGGEGKSA